MILLHLFCSAVPRAMDTPRMRTLARTLCVVLLGVIFAGALLRGSDESPEPTAPAAGSGRGNVSIIHLPDGAAVDAPAKDGPVSVGVAEGPAEQPAAPAEIPAPTGPEQAAAPEPVQGDAGIIPTPEPAEQADLRPISQASAEAVVQSSEPSRLPASSVAGRPEPVDDFAESGRRLWLAGDYVAAERAFTRALTADVPVERKRGLVLDMAELYRAANQLPKAAAVLEKFIKTYPSDRDIPQVLLHLGGVYRDLGVYSMATSRFFQVLNSTLRVSDEDLPHYRKFATKARLEIAETYAMQGNLTEAEKYFSRLQLLELDPGDRERVLLRGAQMQFTLRQWLAAEKALAAFIAASPESPQLAEVRYMRARALDEMGRKQEAIDEVVALLQMPVTGNEETLRSTAYWKRRCANELANRFYEQGDFLGALAIYQALARASVDPGWRWPAVYQIGLCFERMEMPQRAAEAYDAILSPEAAPAPGVRLPDALASLQEMARWRRSHLTWIEDKGRQLERLAADDPAG